MAAMIRTQQSTRERSGRTPGVSELRKHGVGFRRRDFKICLRGREATCVYMCVQQSLQSPNGQREKAHERTRTEMRRARRSREQRITFRMEMEKMEWFLFLTCRSLYMYLYICHSQMLKQTGLFKGPVCNITKGAVVMGWNRKYIWVFLFRWSHQIKHNCAVFICSW